MIELAPSLLSADFLTLGEQISEIEECGLKYLHFDVMDGTFCPNISMGIPVLEAVCGHFDMLLDVHLMIITPINFIEKFSEAGADIITVHIEAFENETEILDSIREIKQCGKKASLSIKITTPVEKILPYLSYLDMAVVMSVEPGFGGQKFIAESLNRVNLLSKCIKANGLSTKIEIDGGINLTNVGKVIESGADIVVSGSSVFKDDAITRNVAEFKKIFKEFDEK